MPAYTFYQDPGHGWIKVLKSELADLGIAHQISRYSYERGLWAYLEEDSDASKWITAYEARHGARPELNEVYQENTPFRNYDSYAAPAAPAESYPMVEGPGAPQYTFALPDQPTQLSLL